MHDVLEGSLYLQLKHLLKNCIQRKKYFSLDDLNSRIHSFYFGTADSMNRPTAFGNDVLTSLSNTLKQSCKVINYLANAIQYEIMGLICT